MPKPEDTKVRAKILSSININTNDSEKVLDSYKNRANKTFKAILVRYDTKFNIVSKSCK